MDSGLWNIQSKLKFMKINEGIKVKNMNIWRMSTVFVLLPCISVFSLSSNASNDQVVSESIELSDEKMQGVIGSGNVDVEMADYKVGGSTAEATLANRSLVPLLYEMNVVKVNGQIIETLTSGTIDPGQAMVITGNPPYGGDLNRRINTRVFVDHGVLSALLDGGPLQAALEAIAGGPVDLGSLSGNLKHLEVSDSSWAGSSIDSDNDGLADFVELRLGLDPDNPDDADEDWDNDGLSNKDEILLYRTDINNSDSDSDGISDSAEIENGLNPKDANDANLDPDRDFVSNADEINSVPPTDINTYDAGLAVDTDGDGINDIVEMALGMDPIKSTVNSVGGNTVDDKAQMHVLNRLTFGPTAELANDIATMGVSNWVADQLIPIGYANLSGDITLVADPAQVMRRTFPTYNGFDDRLTVIRPIHSVKHIQTRMASFWDNHFNTHHGKTRTESELHEEDLFFANALGNFRTLLGESAKNDAMMHYLDLRGSTKNSPNENYAREVMELHTFGQTTDDGPYTPDDVNSLAKLLTGWYTSTTTTDPANSLYGVRYNDRVIYNKPLYKFLFKSYNHDQLEKTFLGTVYPENGGLAEGDAALDALAYHNRTAEFICEKIAIHLVTDSPSPAMLDACGTVFIANHLASDQIAQVIQSLIASADFNDVTNQRGKFKDNQEYMLALARFTGVIATGTTMPDTLINSSSFAEDIQETDQGLGDKHEPTGWYESADTWITSNASLHRFREGNEMAYFGSDTATYFSDLGLMTSGDILGHVFKLMLGGHYGNREMEMGYWVLHPNGAAFDITGSYANARLENLIARVAQLSEHNLH